MRISYIQVFNQTNKTMKRIFTFLSVLLLAGFCMGQQMIFQDFTGVSTMPPSGWTIDAQSANWKVVNSANAGGTAPEAKLTWTPEFNTTTRLISPVIDMTGKTKALIQMKHMVDHYGNSYQIGIATRKDNGTWHPVWTKTVTAPIPAEMVSVVAENDDLNSSTFQFCIFFSGSSYNLNDWYMDDISLLAPYNFDAGIAGLDIPSYFLDDTPVKGNLVNFGSTEITSLKLSYQIGDQTPVVQDFTGLNLGFGDDFDFEFTELMSLDPGSYNVKVEIEEVNGQTSDDFADNNIVEKAFSVPSQSASRRPLFEEFTSSTCGPCASFNSSFFNGFVTTNADQITLVKYQMNWPGSGDPYYTAEGGVRRNYYGVNGVPALFVDGMSTATSGAAVNSVFAQQLSAPAFLNIDGFHTINGTEIEVVGNFNSFVDLSNMTAYLVVFENVTTGNTGGNGETSFKHVMMKMIPNASGSSLILEDGCINQIHQVVNLASTNIEEYTDLGVAIFLQDNTSKYVMQSNYSTEQNLPYYTVTFTKTGNGYTNLFAGDYYYYENGTVTLKAGDKEGFVFEKWIVNGADVTEPNYEFTITANSTVEAVFSGAETFTVDISVEGQGTVTPEAGSHTYNAGSNFTLTAEPAENYHFVKYVINGTDETTNPLEVTVNEDLTIVAHFDFNDLVPENENNMGVTLFPNPSNGKVVASFAQSFDNVLINLININGQVVSSREIKEITNGSQIEFNLDNLSDGLYYLQVTSGNKTSVYKISLQK